LEPNPTIKEEPGIKVIRGFFDENYALPPTDAVVHSHVFEHMYEPAQFMQELSSAMPEASLLLFSLPNLHVWMEQFYTTAINFEHSVLLTQPYIEYLLNKHGFEIVEIKPFREDHSLFYAARRVNKASAPELPQGLYASNKRLFNNWVAYHTALIEDLHQRMRGHKKVFLFGAHVFSQYLLAFGLNPENITSVLDNDPTKQGKRLYGTSLNVQSPRCLAKEKEPTVILRAGIYNKEIKADILQNINSKTVFLE
jgi:hypothetical protein